ncbi:hypothetical protein E2C01_007455 [Portunus trituberculatus]|uniref:Uncharacterized protein n=1 Tax=Portunus trituberculatus TaxID=210409 RepID=A0A5B7D175_PORTR|nr:hypothetical protein [Portunus trituberculatus]
MHDSGNMRGGLFRDASLPMISAPACREHRDFRASLAKLPSELRAFHYSLRPSFLHSLHHLSPSQRQRREC